jgi:hypothetical protein
VERLIFRAAAIPYRHWQVLIYFDCDDGEIRRLIPGFISGNPDENLSSLFLNSDGFLMRQGPARQRIRLSAMLSAIYYQRLTKEPPTIARADREYSPAEAEAVY